MDWFKGYKKLLVEESFSFSVFCQHSSPPFPGRPHSLFLSYPGLLAGERRQYFVQPDYTISSEKGI